jgi:uncharacterized protein
MTQEITCPYCKGAAAWAGNPYRPFCSERCKMIDLGKWAEGEYRIPDAPASSDVIAAAGGDPSDQDE